MAKKQPLFEADLGENGGAIQLWTAAEVEAFITREQDFWGVMAKEYPSNPISLVVARVRQLAEGLRTAVEANDTSAGSSWLSDVYGHPRSRIPLSTSAAAKGVFSAYTRYGPDAMIGALSMALPTEFWSEGISHGSRPYWRGIVEQVLFESGISQDALEAAQSAVSGAEERISRVLADAQLDFAEQLRDGERAFAAALNEQAKRNGELERQRAAALLEFNEAASDLVTRLENADKAYLERMRLKAPVGYWRDKAVTHRGAADKLKFSVWAFFGISILGYALIIVFYNEPIAAFLLQFKESAGALFVISAALALLASMPLWIGRLIIKFYLSEHHLATDAKEREVMTQTYLALTAEGVVTEKERSLVLAALFRNTPDGVVKDNAQPDAGPAALITKLLDR